MSAAHKSECPAATGQSANQKENNFNQILAVTQAKLELAGFGVHHVDGGWLVCRWGMSKLCADFAELRAFGKKVGAI